MTPTITPRIQVEVIQFQPRGGRRLARKQRRALYFRLQRKAMALRKTCARCEQRQPRYYIDFRGVCFECRCIEFQEWMDRIAQAESAKVSAVNRLGAALAWAGLDIDPLWLMTCIHRLIESLDAGADDGWIDDETEPEPEPELSPQARAGEILMAEGVVIDESHCGPTAEVVDLEKEIYDLTGVWPVCDSDDETWALYRAIDRCLAAYRRAIGAD